MVTRHWLVFVVLYDIGLLGLLLADTEQRISPALFSGLMLVNPTDAYRIFNLMGSEGASLVSGLAGLADQVRLGTVLPVAVMALWVAARGGEKIQGFGRVFEEF